MGRETTKEEKAKEDLIKLQDSVLIEMFQKYQLEPYDWQIESLEDSVAKAIAGDEDCRNWLDAEVEDIKNLSKREEIQNIMNSLAESIKDNGKFCARLNEQVKDEMEVNTFEAFEGADEPDKGQTSASVVDERVEKEYTSESVDEKQTLEPENAVACNKIVHTCDLLDDQLEGIKEEPGLVTDEKTAISAKNREWIATNEERCPLPVMQVIMKELTKLQQFDTSWGAFHVTRDYLDYLTTFPWGKYSTENYNVEMAKEVLQDDPFCPTAVKNGIDEFIALSKRLPGIIICLSHLPGVDTTSYIACLIARALNRKFCQLSIGGVADIKGHCQLYDGATLGKMVECLKNAGTLDPLVLIDKIDKVGTGLDAELASALSDLLDPRKNEKFLDHCLNVPIDISKVLFVCTTDVIKMIPEPPLERMVEITLGDYSTNEKMRIAKYYLKTICEELCIKPEKVEVSDAALRALIEKYNLEAGVHSLRSYIQKILRKVAMKFEEAGPSNEPLDVDRQDMQADEKIAIKGIVKVSIDTHNLHEFAGKPDFYPERVYPSHQTPDGVAIGLCCTEYRGSIMTIETSKIQREIGKGGSYHATTGLLGPVMRDSADIALTVSKEILLEKDPNNTFFANFDIHLHIPDGAMSKDGPSAGCAMTTALLSLAMKKPVKNDLAMTGEITLGRKIRPIGGVKEKMIGARRNGMTTIIFPSANKMDFCEIAPDMGEDSYVHFVDDYNEIFNLAFGDH